MAAVTILQWNARGLHAHCREFKQTVFSHQYDVVCVQETWLREGRSYEIRGYETFKKNRPPVAGKARGQTFFVFHSILSRLTKVSI
jgi:exonuclease III